MKQLLAWTLEAIREEDSCFSWMEEHRFEWVPLVRAAIDHLMSGKTMLVATDDAHAWFGRYILSEINRLDKARPLLPLYGLAHCYPDLAAIRTTQEIEVFEDMLEISYPNGYMFWYIGHDDHPVTKIVFRNEESFLWLFDSQTQDSFSLRSHDAHKDIKLLQMYALFDKILSAILFGEIDTTQ